jgi:hypothetical protein
MARADLTNALVAEVRRRSGPWTPPLAMRELDVVAFTRSRVEPMVRGLFPQAEQNTVLALVERSVVFLTPGNIDAILRGESWPRTAWDIANLYLGSIGAELLGEDAPRIVGLSAGTTCFLSPAYFEEEHPFADFLVHEVAHIFHNCKRRTAGLVETRRREWLLDISFRRRETFAYACEAYARVLDRAATTRERTAIAAEIDRDFATGDERVDPGEVADIVREASARRNGWKVVLRRCAAPPRPKRTAALPDALGQSD